MKSIALFFLGFIYVNTSVLPNEIYNKNYFNKYKRKYDGKYIEKKYRIRKPVLKRSKKYIEKKYGYNNPKDFLAGTVYFNYSSPELSSKGLTQTSEVAKNLHRYLTEPVYNRDYYREDEIDEDFSYVDYYSNYRIKVIGFADASGSSNYNLDLGLLRAEEVARHLEKFGIQMREAIIASYGESRASSKSSKYRRVEVWLTTKDSYNNTFLLFVFLFFGILIIVGSLFFMFLRKTPYYRIGE